MGNDQTPSGYPCPFVGHQLGFIVPDRSLQQLALSYARYMNEITLMIMFSGEGKLLLHDFKKYK